MNPIVKFANVMQQKHKYCANEQMHTTLDFNYLDFNGRRDS